MQYGPSHDHGFQIGADLKRGAKKRFPSAVVITTTALLTIGIWLTLPIAPSGHLQAQQSQVTPTPEQRPERGSGEGAGRRPGGRSGNADGGNRPAPSDAAVEQTPTTADSGEIEAVDMAQSPSIARSSRIVAIAGIDGARLADRPQGTTLYTVPMGTTLQVAGRTDDGKWLYVVRDAVIKGGKAVAPALAGWTATADVIAFSVENLPVLDAETTPIILPEPGPNDAPQSAEQDGDGPASPADDAASSADDVVGSAVEQDSQQVAEPGDTDSEETMAVAGVVNLVDSRLNLRVGPGTATAIAGKLQPNQSVTVLGRSEDSTWLLVSDGLSPVPAGWAAADFIDVDVELTRVPVASVSAIPTPSSMLDLTPAAAALAQEPSASTATAGIAISAI